MRDKVNGWDDRRTPSSALAIARAMKKKGITEAALARKLERPVPWVNAVKRGHRIPSVPNAIRIARALDTTVEALWGKTPKEIDDDVA